MKYDELISIEYNVKKFMKKNKKLTALWRWFKKNTMIRLVLKYTLIFLVLWGVFLLLKRPLLTFIEGSETLSLIFDHMILQIENRTYLGLFYGAIIGALAFMSMPVEIISLYYFKNDYIASWVIVVCVVGILIGMIINYFIGYLFGQNVLRIFLRKNYDGVERKLMKYGGWIIFGLSVIISPVDLFVLVCGSMKYPFKKMIRIIAFAQTIKFIAIYFMLGWFSKTLIPFMRGLF